MKEEEALRLILQSPDAGQAFDRWMNLQWAELAFCIATVIALLLVFILGWKWTCKE